MPFSEAARAVEAGAKELDMVIIGHFSKSNNTPKYTQTS